MINKTSQTGQRYHELTWADVDSRLDHLLPSVVGKRVYGIPRGGSIVTGLLRNARFNVDVVDDPWLADILVDDIIDSGTTKERVLRTYELDTVALINKQDGKDRDAYPGWVVFPWEDIPGSPAKTSSGIDIAVRLLEYIGEDPKRNGLIDTPKRMVKAWDEMLGGYYQNPDDLLTWFIDDTDEMVVLKGIEFYSTCEHHLLPFYGTAAVGYIPTGRVLGISKLARLVDVFARRLQVQERLTRQVGEFLEQHTEHVAVHVEAVHMCMMARGVKQQGSSLVTNYLTGAFRDKPEARQEFFSTVKGNG